MARWWKAVALPVRTHDCLIGGRRAAGGLFRRLFCAASRPLAHLCLPLFRSPGPFIKLGPLRDADTAEIAGCLGTAGLVIILTLALTIYGQATFQTGDVTLGRKTLSGRDLKDDPLQSSEGWAGFTSGWLFGGLSGVAWAYILTQ